MAWFLSPGRFANVAVRAPAAGGGGGSLLVDVLGTTAIRAYSLRKVRSAYAGSAIKIRRSSDNATQDIGFDGSGNLDTAAISSFVGANSAFIDTWYDQSTTADHAVQATTGNQPRIVDTGTLDTLNSLPVIRFGVSASVALDSAASATIAEAVGLVAITTVLTFGDYLGALYGSGAGQAFLLGDSGAANWYTGAGFTTVHSNNGGTAACVMNSALQQVDGFGSGASATTIQLGYGETGQPGRQWTGWIGEMLIFAAQLSAGDRTVAYTNQKAYWGTP